MENPPESVFKIFLSVWPVGSSRSRRKMAYGIPDDRSFEERVGREPIALSNFLDFSCTNLSLDLETNVKRSPSSSSWMKWGWRKRVEEGGRRGKEDSSNDALLLSVCIPRCTYIGIGHAWQDAWLATPVKTRKTRRIQTRLVPFAPFQDSLPPRLLFGSFFLLLFASPFLMKNVERRRIYIEEECTVVMKSAISLIAAWRVWGMEDGDLWKEREREFDAIYWDNSKILNEFNLRKRHYSWKNNFENKENTMCMVIIIIFVRNKLKIK